MKIAGSGSGSLVKRHGSANPDPHQNVMDPQHCIQRILSFYVCSGLTIVVRFVWCDADIKKRLGLIQPRFGLLFRSFLTGFSPERLSK
jgi:hypothetical protein